jgi:hypothetical protein
VRRDRSERSCRKITAGQAVRIAGQRPSPSGACQISRCIANPAPYTVSGGISGLRWSRSSRVRMESSGSRLVPATMLHWRHSRRIPSGASVPMAPASGPSQSALRVSALGQLDRGARVVVSDGCGVSLLARAIRGFPPLLSRCPGCCVGTVRAVLDVVPDRSSVVGGSWEVYAVRPTAPHH